MSRNARLSRPVIRYAQCQITPLVIAQRSSFVFWLIVCIAIDASYTTPTSHVIVHRPTPADSVPVWYRGRGGGWCQTGSLSPLCQVPTLYSPGAMRQPVSKINYNRSKTNEKKINNSNKEKRCRPMACRSLDSSLLLIRNLRSIVLFTCC